MVLFMIISKQLEKEIGIPTGLWESHVAHPLNKRRHKALLVITEMLKTSFKWEVKYDMSC